MSKLESTVKAYVPERSSGRKIHLIDEKNPDLKTLCGIDTTEKLIGYHSQNIEKGFFKKKKSVCRKCAKVI